ncbi:MAG: NADH-quinone oxidoreductase subunit M [Anaerolineae bacterium]|nr:NADH-quinone oxidoreductase subunit M [Anaerolineae bacterium]
MELQTTGVSIASVVLFAPLVGLIPLLFFGRLSDQQVRISTLITTLVTFGFSLLMLGSFDSADGGMQLEHIEEWIPGLGIYYHVGVDGISIWLVMLTTLIMPIAVLASWTSITERLRLYHGFLLMLETAMLGVFLSLDLFMFYIFWEISLVPMYFMIGIWGSKDKTNFFGREMEARIYAAVKFFLYTMAGSILMLLAILWLGNNAGTFDVTLISQMLRDGTLLLDTDTERLLFLGFFLAFAIKVPIWPLHSWLPDAHVQAPTAGSIILAGVLLKLGTYGLVRFNLDFFPNAAIDFAPYIAALAVIGILYGAWVSYAQTDVKKLVAYSSVSHLGFVVLGIFALNSTGVQGAVLQMVNHGISTGGLFLLVGMLYERRHTKAMNAFGGIWKVMPIYSGFALVITLSSMGLPGLNGFVGEFTILLGSANSEVISIWYTVLATIGVILAAVYMLYMFNNVFMGSVDKEENQELEDLSWRRNWYELSALIPLVILAFVIGLYPTVFFELMDGAVSNLVSHFDATLIAGR